MNKSELKNLLDGIGIVLFVIFVLIIIFKEL